MRTYRNLSRQVFALGKWKLVPLRHEDRYLIMKWRNEQIYHLRQSEGLTEKMQDDYFATTINSLFIDPTPRQILFSYLQDDECIGYGGLVHINYPNRNAELSFLIDTSLEKDYFETHWSIFLSLIQDVAFDELKFHKIFTYAYDIRPRLYPVLERQGFDREAVLREHAFFDQRFIDVVIHSKLFCSVLRSATFDDMDTTFRWATDRSVREFSFSKEEIKWNNHVEWFSKKLSDPNCHYFILQEGDAALGSIRFDIDDKSAIISFLIDPLYQKKGYGKLIIEKGIQLLWTLRSDLDTVIGLVDTGNEASVRVFRKLEFGESKSSDTIIQFTKNIQR